MKVILPVTVTSTNMMSNVGETLPVWSAVTTYALGDQVRDATTNHAYESLAASNLNHALTDATKWLDLGPTNRWAMFDTSNSTQTTNPGYISVIFSPVGERLTGLGLFNLSGTSVEVLVTGPSGTVSDTTYSLISTAGITDWWLYFFSPVTYKTDFVLTDLPIDAGSSLQVIIYSDTTAACGTFASGQALDMGVTTYGARAGITDYSKKEADAFGNYQIVPRSYAKRLSFKVVVDADKVDNFYNQLAALRTTPLVYVGADEYTSTAALGFWKDCVMEISTVNKSYLSLEIEGLS